MSKRVLIVDDDRAIAQLATVWLRPHGFATAAVYDGDTALRFVDKHRPDLILLDLRMPGMDGLEVQNRLRQDARLASTPIVFVSAHAQEVARRQALSNGARGFLTKPYDAEDLIETVNNVLQVEREHAA